MERRAEEAQCAVDRRGRRRAALGQIRYHTLVQVLMVCRRACTTGFDELPQPHPSLRLVFGKHSRDCYQEEEVVSQ
jgi:hypothetical protein